MRVFHEVIRCGSLRAAAKSLGKTQPSVTKTIRELETILGASLMNRSSHGVELTECGLAFSRHSQLILKELDSAVTTVRALTQQVSPKLTIGYSSLLSFTVLPEIINTFKSKHPESSLILKEAQLSSLLGGFVRERSILRWAASVPKCRSVILLSSLFLPPLLELSPGKIIL
ncbi:LysR family transcriptional regulator [Dongshaea marina]|uniref:LysR family transcriptional regulator n=1 Tax=Dongshaea marina TaxID=2047966 RepID=UPI001F3BE42D|nr:LysR family transcriptional regulator [Dongshaea marina]